MRASPGDNEKGETTDYTDYTDFFIFFFKSVPLRYCLPTSCFFGKKLFYYCHLTFYDRNFQGIILEGFFQLFRKPVNLACPEWH
jgi:hypothetical protein